MGKFWEICGGSGARLPEIFILFSLYKKLGYENENKDPRRISHFDNLGKFEKRNF